ncbi:glycosyltransferase family 29 protein [Fulvivirga ligni]|uniref:glycosyltransferase family 29 protein n=1 Tax=Fulvivirga ligni TaxID=2904246 RepID=UPI001F3B2D4D|nr:glycosyltransferase family 29 protein [Fulvivirga ligni]UII23876.1 glycosyltransferase family 29 protein [Fulvivirga ligni]
MRYLKALFGLWIMPFRIRFFNPKKIFLNKRVAVVGPADSTHDDENGDIIDSYDVVIRMNKALVTWNPKNQKYLGTRTDVLFHNFYENMNSGGGGPLDWEIFKGHGVKYLIQPRFDKEGWRLMFNYFKKYLNTKNSIYLFSHKNYSNIVGQFDKYHPTRGFYALSAALESNCKEVFITGFTFFKTPYAEGYRDNIRDMKENEKHIQNQGLHNVDLEYNNFLKLLQNTPIKNVKVDKKLYAIIKSDSKELADKVQIINALNLRNG